MAEGGGGGWVGGWVGGLMAGRLPWRPGRFQRGSSMATRLFLFPGPYFEYNAYRLCVWSADLGTLELWNSGTRHGQSVVSRFQFPGPFICSRSLPGFTEFFSFFWGGGSCYLFLDATVLFFCCLLDEIDFLS